MPEKYQISARDKRVFNEIMNQSGLFRDPTILLQSLSYEAHRLTVDPDFDELSQARKAERLANLATQANNLVEWHGINPADRVKINASYLIAPYQTRSGIDFHPVAASHGYFVGSFLEVGVIDKSTLADPHDDKTCSPIVNTDFYDGLWLTLTIPNRAYYLGLPDDTPFYIPVLDSQFAIERYVAPSA